MGLEELRARREEILQIAAEYGARNVRVFNSSPQEAGGGIHLLVEFEPGRSLFDLVGLSLELEELLGRKVRVVSEGGLRPGVREGVLREAIPL